ncbi:hypothetical protein D3227_27310 [Mesorhizobium waimense]|uniref:Uncharacterized protein n=1 Tax=Mesorhizobium waimense TaxID=1300307 RepID=A0A3A5KLY4_9HYPH|nr:hypothetical protein [Mesorhizobium waimense]RJT32111.1 hypothetical protein D3227_27310 [Mesorhizobium waimense]
MDHLSAASIFNSRLSFWTAQGFAGAELYEQLAEDNELPSFFDPDDIAEIQGVLVGSVKKARHRGAGPAFIRLSSKVIKYPRPDYCRHLASKFVRRAA